MFQDKKILVLGIGRSGQAVAEVLNSKGAAVTISDSKTLEEIGRDFADLAAQGIKLELGNQQEKLLDGIDIVVVSPGISINIPLLEIARKRGIEVISEIEVAYRLCQAPIVAITGTNGKTTTTTLTGEMFKAAERPVVVGGNIGTALSRETDGIGPDGTVVAEISSFQLEGADLFHPHIAAVLNLTPDHIDRHGSFENYKLAKEKIFARQNANDYLLLNHDDYHVAAMAARAASQVVFFSSRQVLHEGIFVEDGMLTIRWQGRCEHILKVSDMKLFGSHNVENALVACGAAFFSGVSIAAMANVLRSFSGVEHRIEPVKKIDGVMYYNDSKATNPESAIKALEAFAGHIILIAGGHDKNTDLTEFMNLAKQKTDCLILLGEAAARFKDNAVRCGVDNICMADTFREAVELAHKLAAPPQVVLLSPACSSYDMFTSYEERGNVFKSIVNKL